MVEEWCDKRPPGDIAVLRMEITKLGLLAMKKNGTLEVHQHPEKEYRIAGNLHRQLTDSEGAVLYNVTSM